MAHRPGDGGPQRLLVGGEPLGESFGIGVEGQPAAHHLGAHVRVPGGAARRRPGRSGRAAGGAARPPRGSSSRPARSAPGVAESPSRSTRLTPEGGDVEQDVDEMIGQQVDLVDVEHTLVGRGQQPGPEPRPSPSSSAPRGRACRPRGPRWRRAAARRTARARRGSRRGQGRGPAVDLAEPFSPRSSTPPSAGSTAWSSRASLASSWPTTADSGKERRHVRRSSAQPSASSTASRRAWPGWCPRRATGPGRSASSSRSAIDLQRPRVGLRRRTCAPRGRPRRPRSPARTSSPRPTWAVAS